MQTFNSWLWSHARDDTPTGDLVRDIQADSRARVLMTYEDLRDHLDRHGSDEVVRLLDEAHADHQRSKK